MMCPLTNWKRCTVGTRRNPKTMKTCSLGKDIMQQPQRLLPESLKTNVRILTTICRPKTYWILHEKQTKDKKFCVRSANRSTPRPVLSRHSAQTAEVMLDRTVRIGTGTCMTLSARPDWIRYTRITTRLTSLAMMLNCTSFRKNQLHLPVSLKL